jgi:hypothetical protein
MPTFSPTLFFWSWSSSPMRRHSTRCGRIDGEQAAVFRSDNDKSVLMVLSPVGSAKSCLAAASSAGGRI